MLLITIHLLVATYAPLAATSYLLLTSHDSQTTTINLQILRLKIPYLLRSTHYLLLFTYYLCVAAYCLLRTTSYLLPTADYSTRYLLLTTHDFQFIARYLLPYPYSWPIATYYSLLATYRVLLTIYFLLLTIYESRLPTYYSPGTPQCLLLTTCCSQPTAH